MVLCWKTKMKKEKIIKIKLQKDYPLVTPRKRELKSYEEFGIFLIKLERMPESAIEKIMGDDYIDTPGFYDREKHLYGTVFEFMSYNMGEVELNRLEQWYIKNPKKVKKIIDYRLPTSWR